MKVGDWVNISDAYRKIPHAPQVFYGQIKRVDGGNHFVTNSYYVHCNDDSYHYFFEDELSLIKDRK